MAVNLYFPNPCKNMYQLVAKSLSHFNSEMRSKKGKADYQVSVAAFSMY